MIKIVSVEAKCISVPLKPTNPPSKWAKVWNNQLIVIIRTDTGITGAGEVFVHSFSQVPYAGFVETLSDLIVGMDPTDINKISDTMEKITYTAGRGGIMSAVIAGIDMALHDIVAKIMKIPLYKLIGGKRRDKVMAYASLPRYKTIDELINVVQFSINQGFMAVKLHQGGVKVLDYVREVRNQLGYEFRLMLDLNCSLSALEALSILPKLEQYNISWIEEPLWPPENFLILKELSMHTNIPLAAGENEYSPYNYMKMIQEGGIKIIQPDLAKVGLTRAKKIITISEAIGATVILHCRPQSLWSTILSSIHVGVTLPWENMIEVSPTMPYQEPFEEPIRFDNGYLYPTEVPGIGLKTDGWFEIFPAKKGELPKFIE